MPGAKQQQPEIRTSIHITPLRGRTYTPHDIATPVSTSVSVPVVKPYVLMDDMVESGDMATSDTVGSTSRELPMLQTVGTAPGSAGSRAALLPHPSSVQPTNPAPQAKTLTLEEAIHVIQAAATAGKTFSFEQKNPKTVHV